MIVNAIFVPAVTAILFGLMPSEDVEGITTTFAVAEVPALSKTVIFTVVDSATELGSTVKVLPDTVALGTTAVLSDNAGD